MDMEEIRVLNGEVGLGPRNHRLIEEKYPSIEDHHGTSFGCIHYIGVLGCITILYICVYICEDMYTYM